jgi:tripartite-type tricarboxylate transporter receptor subunit TctC
LSVVGWVGVVGPRGMPPAIVDRLNKAINKILAMPSIKDTFAERGVTVVTTTPQQFGEFIKAEVGAWTQVVKASGVAID